MSRSRHCANCGWEVGPWPRWCADCWRMASKAFLSTLVTAAGVWTAAHWLELTKAVLGMIFN